MAGDGQTNSLVPAPGWTIAWNRQIDFIGLKRSVVLKTGWSDDRKGVLRELPVLPVRRATSEALTCSQRWVIIALARVEGSETAVNTFRNEMPVT